MLLNKMIHHAGVQMETVQYTLLKIHHVIGMKRCGSLNETLKRRQMIQNDITNEL